MKIEPTRTHFLNQKEMTRVEGSHRTYVVRDLSPSTEYELLVFALNNEGKSNASDSITFRTLPGQLVKSVFKYL